MASLSLSQSDLAEAVELDVYEFQPVEGEYKSLKDYANPDQREVVAQLGEGSKYPILVRLVTCVHGSLDNSVNKKLATLVVFDFNVMSTSEKKVKAVIARFEFNDKDYFAAKLPQPAVLSSPSIIAYAPFSVQKRFHRTTAKKHKKENVVGKIGVTHPPVDVGLQGEKVWESTHTQRYFDKGGAMPYRDDRNERWSKVEFSLQQNASQNLGISPHFRTAILLERKSYADFIAKFTIHVEAGLGYELSRALDFKGRSYLDTPVKFTPKADPQGEHLDIIKSEHLGKWHTGDFHLSFPTPVYGMDLEPVLDEDAEDDDDLADADGDDQGGDGGDQDDSGDDQDQTA